MKSQSRNGKYEVLNTSLGWKCSCPDHIYRGVKCKHIWAVEFSLAFKKEVKARRVEEVAETKYKHDARKLFQLAKKVTGKKPETLITDGLKSYHQAYKREFWTLRKPRTEHIRHIKIRGDMNNNKMERLNGEIRDREKVMRGLKKEDTPILKGYQIFHNYIREHEGLKGKTPAEACGITIEGKNKWKTLIQNASISN